MTLVKINCRYWRLLKIKIEFVFGTLILLDGRGVYPYFIGSTTKVCYFCKDPLDEQLAYSNVYLDGASKKEAYDEKFYNSFCQECYDKMVILAKVNKKI